jgi:osmotically-inducible protein OsmY
MEKTRKRSRWLVLLVLVACGCNGEDGDRLSRMGRAAVAKLESLSGTSRDQVVSSWQAFRSDLSEATLAARVSARIRWDNGLQDAKVEVQSKDGEVQLKGTVRDLVQRRRAVELAESTVGTQKVVDDLQMLGQEP